MGREMDEQPEVLRRVADSAAEIRERVRAVVPDPLDGIAFVGRGSSDNAAMLGRYASELAAHRPAGLAAPSLHTRYDSPVNYSGYLVIGLSQSGATPEVVATCERLRASGAVVIAITNDDSSALAAVSEKKPAKVDSRRSTARSGSGRRSKLQSSVARKVQCRGNAVRRPPVSS